MIGVPLSTTRKLVETESMTLGVIDLADGWFAPPGVDGGADTTDLEETLSEQMGAQDGVLLGRLTFEALRAYWPKQTGDSCCSCARPAGPGPLRRLTRRVSPETATTARQRSCSRSLQSSCCADGGRSS